jgi:nickel-dependent lactate racemase
MHISINFGRQRFECEVPENQVVPVGRGPSAPPLADPAAAVRKALESPLDFPALRKALTPDDHIVIVVDEHLPHLPQMLVSIVEHVRDAGVAAGAIVFLCLENSSPHSWREQLPKEIQHIRMEYHDPKNRQRLSYLATTRRGRRIYFNRTAVDADQLVVLAGRGYDPILGYSGAEGFLYPGLIDEATQKELSAKLSMGIPGKEPWPVQREAGEVTWLLGAPFLIQVIEGAGDDLVHVLGGLAATGAEGQKLLDAQWKITVADRADIVIAGMSGDPTRHDFASMARAMAAASRVVKPGGSILLLTQAHPSLGRGADIMRQMDEAEQALALIREETPADYAPAFQWASTAKNATIYLLSNLPAEVAEELFTIPLEHPGQVHRLLNGRGSFLFLPDAHKTLAVPGTK